MTFVPTAAAALLLAIAPAAIAAPVKRDPKHRLTADTSTNWSGYDVTGGGATHVIGTWTAPLVTCAAGENSWSSPWVGIDGDTSGTVEQIGTDSDCVNGNPYYYAWYEMYPKSLVQISMPVVAGHSYTGEVTYAGGSSYQLKLTDNNAKTPPFVTTQSGRKTQNASVEWIMEGPSNGLLSDFTSVNFSGASATMAGTAVAPGSANANAITMVTRKGAVRAQPGSPTGGGSAFSVTWQQG